MKNTLKTNAILRMVGIVGLALVIGFTITACSEDDDPLNGTWTYTPTSGEKQVYTFSNGSYQFSSGSVDQVRGIYIATVDTIQFTPVYVSGAAANNMASYMGSGYSLGLTKDQWYTEDQLKDELDKKNIPSSLYNTYLDTNGFVETEYDYELKSNSLFLTGPYPYTDTTEYKR